MAEKSKCIQLSPICSQDIEQKQKFDNNQGP